MQNHQACLDVMLSAAISYVKMQQVNAESSSLLGCYAEGSNILCKDAASECRNVKLAWMLC